MHFLTLIKPHLLDLPLETVDEIITYISSPSSLLSLARTCKALASLVIPDHLDFRIIRAPLGRTELWESVLRDDLHAANVRSLTIQEEQRQRDWDEAPSKIPPFTGLVPEARRDRAFEDGPGTLEVNQEVMPVFVSAIRHMSRLYEFAWHSEASEKLSGMDDVWAALQELRTVTILHVVDNPCSNSTTQLTPSIVFSDSFLRFSGLTKLTVHTSALDHRPEKPDATPLVDLLLRSCPNLEFLELYFFMSRNESSVSMDNLLLNATWPKLHTLHLVDGAGCLVDPLVRFLKVHPGIKDLSLGRMMPGRSWRRFAQALSAHKPMLPCLKTLVCFSAQAAALLMLPMDCLTDLKGLEMHDQIVIDDWFEGDDVLEPAHDEDGVEEEEEDVNVSNPSPWKARLLERLAACPSIRRLEVVHHGDLSPLEVLATVTPQLTWLDIDTRGIRVEDDIDQWCVFYSLFPCLVKIGAEHLVYQGQYDDKTNQNNAFIQALASACPRLEVLIDWNRKIILIRDKMGQVGTPVEWVSRMLDASEEVEIRDGEVVYPNV